MYGWVVVGRGIFGQVFCLCAKPAVLPGVENVLGEIAAKRERAVKAIGSERMQETPEQKAERKLERSAKREQAKQERAEAAVRAASVSSGGLHFGTQPPEAGNGKSDDSKHARKEAEKAAQRKVAQKNDPRLVAMARELRDRWQEHVAAQPGMLEDRQRGKYDVSRLLEASPQQADAVEIVSEVQLERKRLDAA